MTTYRLALSMGGVVFVDADRYATEGGRICFYRGDAVCAEYAPSSVRDIGERQLTQRVRLFDPVTVANNPE